jgi:hypothetical protein
MTTTTPCTATAITDTRPPRVEVHIGDCSERLSPAEAWTFGLAVIRAALSAESGGRFGQGGQDVDFAGIVRELRRYADDESPSDEG